MVAVPMRTATRRVPPACCARTATGQAAAAPPSSVMNSRRPTKAVICSPSRKVCEDKDSIIRPRVGRYVRLALGHFPQSCSASPPKPSQAELLLCEPVTLPPLLPKRTHWCVRNHTSCRPEVGAELFCLRALCMPKIASHVLAGRALVSD